MASADPKEAAYGRRLMELWRQNLEADLQPASPSVTGGGAISAVSTFVQSLF
jgi:hypothetical protein